MGPYGVTLHALTDPRADQRQWADVAAAAGAILATGNPKDFPMPDLLVQHWPMGE